MVLFILGENKNLLDITLKSIIEQDYKGKSIIENPDKKVFKETIEKENFILITEGTCLPNRSYLKNLEENYSFDSLLGSIYYLKKDDNFIIHNFEKIIWQGSLYIRNLHESSLKKIIEDYHWSKILEYFPGYCKEIAKSYALKEEYLLDGLPEYYKKERKRMLKEGKIWIF